MKSLADWRKATARRPVPRGSKEPEPVQDCYRRIGAIVLEMRERRSLTQQAVATAMGWTRASIANLENNKQRVMMHDLPRLAKTLGIPVRDLLLPEWTR